MNKQEIINLRDRLKRRLRESTNGEIQCESCGAFWKPEIRIGSKRLPNKFFICIHCGHGECVLASGNIPLNNGFILDKKNKTDKEFIAYMEE